jgi:hypothetical protein
MTRITLLWWIDETVESAEDFIEWQGALGLAEVIRARLLGDGWKDAT